MTSDHHLVGFPLFSGHPFYQLSDGLPFDPSAPRLRSPVDALLALLPEPLPTCVGEGKGVKILMYAFPNRILE